MSRAWLFGVAMVAVAIFGLLLAVPIIPYQKTYYYTVNCNGEYPPPQVGCRIIERTYRVIDYLSIAEYVVGHGGQIVNGTYRFG